MKVLIVNTSDRAGGAAIAAGRLVDALNNNGVKARMMVRDKTGNDITVAAVGSKWRRQWSFLWERFVLFCHMNYKREHLFDIDIANSGIDITRTREFRQADVIHLHWVNQGFLSLSSIRKILRSGKPVVWTMHDMWPATAVCHLTLGCRRFASQCGNCRYLPGNAEHDLAWQVWQRKQKLYKEQHITFVACSRWLETEAKSSTLLRGHRVTNIPNTIDTHVFRPGLQQEARDAERLPMTKRLILFVCQRATNPYKGMDYLTEACQKLTAEHPEMKDEVAVAVLGGHAEEVTAALPFESFALGYVSDERRMARIYQASDVFVLPSLSENLPNTIMEALACGIPSVAFKVGGIAEEIDHQKNGYVAQYRSADDLARGIRWTLYEADRQALAAAAVKKVAQNYSAGTVAMRYIEVYQQALAEKHFKL